MKKFILSALTVGAMAVGSAASAQDWGIEQVIPQVLGNIFGITTPGAIPGVVAQGQGQIYADQYGRRFYYDQYGRQVYVDQGTQIYGQGNVYGRTVYDAWGRPVVLDQFNTYVDRYGVRMHVDAYGRHVRLDQYGSYRDQYGRTVYLGSDRRPLYIEQNGQLFAAASSTTAYANPRDRDGDGIRNRDDRYPDDPRYR